MNAISLIFVLIMASLAEGATFECVASKVKMGGQQIASDSREIEFPGTPNIGYAYPFNNKIGAHIVISNSEIGLRQDDDDNYLNMIDIPQSEIPKHFKLKILDYKQNVIITASCQEK